VTSSPGGEAHWTMPAEWQPHERTWMAWPPAGYTLGDTDEEALEARTCWSSVANAIIRFEPVTIVVDPADVDGARAFLDPEVTIVAAPLDDAWIRDIGPTFVVGPAGDVAGVDWVFNGWGAQPWATWGNDSLVAARVCEAAGVPTVASPMINEGGGIHVNGEGAVLVTRTVQLGEGRNETWSAEQVEAELGRTLGADRVIWVERGLTRDYDRFGTRGHIDILTCFVRPGVVLAHNQQDPAHPDHDICAEYLAILRGSTDAKGRPLEVIEVPAPATTHVDGEIVDWGYLNHYICNGAVILCTFDDPNDQVAIDILSRVYAGREIVPHDARDIFACGGGIHCITQQQPKV
jgi:agmatine deiminase